MEPRKPREQAITSWQKFQTQIFSENINEKNRPFKNHIPSPHLPPPTAHQHRIWKSSTSRILAMLPKSTLIHAYMLQGFQNPRLLEGTRFNQEKRAFTRSNPSYKGNVGLDSPCSLLPSLHPPWNFHFLASLPRKQNFVEVYQMCSDSPIPIRIMRNHWYQTWLQLMGRVWTWALIPK